MPAVNTAGVSKQKIKNTNRGQDNKKYRFECFSYEKNRGFLALVLLLCLFLSVFLFPNCLLTAYKPAVNTC